jgi:uncharacterized protein (DUF1015 family)
VPRFEPFPGLRYDRARADLALVTAPPYDVIDAADRQALAQRDPHNIVRIDVPVDDDGRADPYAAAADRLQAWQRDGVLTTDSAPSFTVYRMTFTDEAGHRHKTLGVIGALEVSRAAEGGDVLPHERTTPKARSDRLRLLQATEANLSAIWGLSLAHGLSDAIAPTTEPDAQWTDPGGVTHEVWRVDDAAAVEGVSQLAGSAPVVIADGHHRYDVALTYRDERRKRAEGAAGPYDLTTALLVELASDQLVVQPIHRLLTGFRSLDDLVTTLNLSFTFTDAGAVTPVIGDRLVQEGALALVRPDGTATLLHPRPGAFDGVDDLDSARLDHALADLPHEQTYQHGIDLTMGKVSSGEAAAAVLLRPVTVSAIEAMAHARGLMPPKSTFFAPKPATGVVIRSL